MDHTVIFMCDLIDAEFGLLLLITFIIGIAVGCVVTTFCRDLWEGHHG